MVNLQIEYFNVRRLDGHCWMGTDGEGRVLVTGAGEFIGHHLVTCLVERGYSVRGIDLKAPEYKKAASDDFVIADLWGHDECLMVTKDIDEIYHFAADMRSTIASRAFSGSCGLITVHPVDDLVDMVCKIANKALVRRHIPRDRRGCAERTVTSRG